MPSKITPPSPSQLPSPLLATFSTVNCTATTPSTLNAFPGGNGNCAKTAKSVTLIPCVTNVSFVITTNLICLNNERMACEWLLYVNYWKKNIKPKTKQIWNLPVTELIRYCIVEHWGRVHMLSSSEEELPQWNRIWLLTTSPGFESGFSQAHGKLCRTLRWVAIWNDVVPWAGLWGVAEVHKTTFKKTTKRLGENRIFPSPYPAARCINPKEYEILRSPGSGASLLKTGQVYNYCTMRSICLLNRAISPTFLPLYPDIVDSTRCIFLLPPRRT